MEGDQNDSPKYIESRLKMNIHGSITHGICDLVPIELYKM